MRLNSRNAEALSGLSDAAAGSHRQEEALAWLQSLATAEPENAIVRIELSHLLAAMGKMDQAAAAAEDAMRLAPGDPRAGEQLASVFADAGDAVRLAPLADTLVARYPQRDKPRFYRATALLLTDHAREAIDESRQLLGRNPKDPLAQNLLGVACATAGLRECAISAFRAALAANPRHGDLRQPWRVPPPIGGLSRGSRIVLRRADARPIFGVCETRPCRGPCRTWRKTVGPDLTRASPR